MVRYSLDRALAAAPSQLELGTRMVAVVADAISTGTAELPILEAIHSALIEEMQRDESLLIGGILPVAAK